jgi:hypothetical protein
MRPRTSCSRRRRCTATCGRSGGSTARPRAAAVDHGGAAAASMTHPRYAVPRVYQAALSGPWRRRRRASTLDDGHARRSPSCARWPAERHPGLEVPAGTQRWRRSRSSAASSTRCGGSSRRSGARCSGCAGSRWAAHAAARARGGAVPWRSTCTRVFSGMHPRPLAGRIPRTSPELRGDLPGAAGGAPRGLHGGGGAVPALRAVGAGLHAGVSGLLQSGAVRGDGRGVVGRSRSCVGWLCGGAGAARGRGAERARGGADSSSSRG